MRGAVGVIEAAGGRVLVRAEVESIIVEGGCAVRRVRSLRIAARAHTAVPTRAGRRAHSGQGRRARGGRH